MDNISKVSLLMATYNGAPFLKEQLDSLRRQTYTNWELIIRDDGSTDQTIAIINAYIKNDNRVSLIINETEIKGACANFSALLSHITARGDFDYIMFADQDDIWKPEKIERSLLKLRELEHRIKGEAALVYSDLELVDAQGHIIPGQLKLKQQIKLNNLISYNYVYGCTLIFNYRMAYQIREIPPHAKNHDFWIALVASTSNSVFLNEKLIRYRQHHQNASGNVAGNNSLTSRINRLLLNPHYEISAFRRHLETLIMFESQQRQLLDPQQSVMLRSYLGSFKINRLTVCYNLVKYKIFRKGFFQTLVHFYLIIFFFKKIKAKIDF